MLLLFRWSSYNKNSPCLSKCLMMCMQSAMSHLSCYIVIIYKIMGWEHLSMPSWLICSLPAATHSSILAWTVPWTEKPGGLQSIGSERVGHDWSDLAHMYLIKETLEETLTDYFLGLQITADGDCSHEIKSRLLLGRKDVINLAIILKSRDIILLTMVCVVKSMVVPVVRYGCESWTIKKAECQRIDPLELWC